MPVLLKMREGALWRIDWDMREVWATKPFELRIEVGEIASLKKRVIRKINPGHDVLRAEGDLFGLGKEIVDAPIEHEPADAPDRHLLLRDDFCGIKHIEIEALGEVFVEEL